MDETIFTLAQNQINLISIKEEQKKNTNISSTLTMEMNSNRTSFKFCITSTEM